MVDTKINRETKRWWREMVGKYGCYEKSCAYKIILSLVPISPNTIPSAVRLKIGRRLFGTLPVALSFDVIRTLAQLIVVIVSISLYPPVPFSRIFSRISIQLSAGFVLHQETDGITFPAEG
jgi:hypothetical protein